MNPFWKAVRPSAITFGLLLHARDLILSVGEDHAGPSGNGGAYAWRSIRAATQAEAIRRAVEEFERELRTWADVRNGLTERIAVDVDAIVDLTGNTAFVETSVVFYVSTDEASERDDRLPH